MKRLTAVVVIGLMGLRAEADVPTFSRDIAPIIWNQCAACHRPGEVAPFTLTSYNDVKKRAKQIARVTHSRIMPPWKPEPGYGEFVNDRRLSDEQIKLIAAWADAGAPEGDAAVTPALPKFTDGWQLGEPDVIVKMPEKYTVRADGRDVFRCFVVPLDIPEGKYIKSVEYRPNNRKVTHHALLFLDSTGKARELDARDPGPGYSAMGGVGFTPSGGLGGWAPGGVPHTFPPGVSKEITKGTDLIIQTHFHPSGKEETADAAVGIYLTNEAPKRLFTNIPLGIRSIIDIPPGEKNYKWADTFTLPVAIEIPGLTPHAHYLCKDMKVWATLPSGETKWLLWIRDWDFNWQGQYRYKDPVKLPAGTKISMLYTYDNSAQNERNPANPPIRVKRGEQTNDEMGITFIQAIPDGFVDSLKLRKGMAEKFSVRPTPADVAAVKAPEIK